MIEQLNTISGLWWTWTVAMFWQVGVLIVLIACIDRLTRRWTWPQLRYALWSLVLIKLVLPPTLSLPVSIAPRLTPVVTQALSTATDREPGDSLAYVVSPPSLPESGWASELPILPIESTAPVAQPAIEGRVGPAHRGLSAPAQNGVRGTP